MLFLVGPQCYAKGCNGKTIALWRFGALAGIQVCLLVESFSALALLIKLLGVPHCPVHIHLNGISRGISRGYDCGLHYPILKAISIRLHDGSYVPTPNHCLCVKCSFMRLTTERKGHVHARMYMYHLPCKPDRAFLACCCTLRQRVGPHAAGYLIVCVGTIVCVPPTVARGFRSPCGAFASFLNIRTSGLSNIN